MNFVFVHIARRTTVLRIIKTRFGDWIKVVQMIGRVDFIARCTVTQTNIRHELSYEIVIFWIWLLKIREIKVSRKFHVIKGIYPFEFASI